MRQLILDAAREIFLEKGYHQTSIRNIADKIEYSPGTIYLYFKEKDEIFFALHNESFGKLFSLVLPLAAVQDPFERLKAMGRIYLRFAFENKDLYDLMFIMNAPMNVIEESCEWQNGQRVMDILLHTLQECQQQGRFAGMDLNALGYAVWGAVHGMAAIYCRNRIGVICKHNHEELLEETYTTFVQMLEKN